MVGTGKKTADVEKQQHKSESLAAKSSPKWLFKAAWEMFTNGHT